VPSSRLGSEGGRQLSEKWKEERLYIKGGRNPREREKGIAVMTVFLSDQQTWRERGFSYGQEGGVLLRETLGAFLIIYS